MRIGKFRKSPGDRKRYEVNYEDWLNEGEIITDVTMQGNVPADGFYVDGYVVDTDGKEVIFYVSGGASGFEYTVRVTVETSMQQIKEDTITFMVTS